MKLVTRIEGGCPVCGDSIQSYTVKVHDHSVTYEIIIGWCPDCGMIKGFIRPDKNDVVRYSQLPEEWKWELIQLSEINQDDD